MKKFFVLFLVLTVSTGLAAFDFGNLWGYLELGINGRNMPYDSEEIPFAVDVGLGYSYYPGSLGIYAELDYGIIFPEIPGIDGKEQNPQILHFLVEPSYRIFSNYDHYLYAYLENENYVWLAPDMGDANASGVIKPKVTYNRRLDEWRFSIGAGVPIAYLNFGYEKDNTWAGLDLTAGVSGNTYYIGTLSIDATLHCLFSPEKMYGQTISGITGISINTSLRSDWLSMSIGMGIPFKDMEIGAPYSYFEELTSLGGMMFNYHISSNIIDPFTFYTDIGLTGIGIKDRDIVASVSIGIRYNF